MLGYIFGEVAARHRIGGSASAVAEVVRNLMACVYVIKSKRTDKLYVGSSREDKADSRVKAHNNGYTISTKSGIPWILIYLELYEDYTQARKRELFLKSGRGREIIKQLIKRHR